MNKLISFFTKNEKKSKDKDEIGLDIKNLLKNSKEELGIYHNLENTIFLKVFDVNVKINSNDLIKEKTKILIFLKNIGVKVIFYSIIFVKFIDKFAKSAQKRKRRTEFRNS